MNSRKDIVIWPRITAAPHILRFAADDLPRINSAFQENEDFFGAAISIAYPAGMEPLPTNRINAIGGNQANRLSYISTTRLDGLAPALIDRHHGQCESLIFAASNARREVPWTRNGTFLNVIYSRRAFFCTHEGYHYAENIAVDTDDDDRPTWGGLMRRDADLTPAQHRMVMPRTNTMHFGASVLTMFVDPEKIGDSNHARMGWVAEMRREAERVLAWRTIKMKKRLLLHPDWDPLLNLETEAP